jgi:hypothetical protein
MGFLNLLPTLSHGSQVPGRLRGLLGLPALKFVDFSDVHIEEDAPCWSDEKGTTMHNIADFARQLKRRRGPARSLVVADYNR